MSRPAPIGCPPRAGISRLFSGRDTRLELLGLEQGEHAHPVVVLALTLPAGRRPELLEGGTKPVLVVRRASALPLAGTQRIIVAVRGPGPRRLRPRDGRFELRFLRTLGPTLRGPTLA